MAELHKDLILESTGLQELMYNVDELIKNHRANCCYDRWYERWQFNKEKQIWQVIVTWD